MSELLGYSDSDFVDVRDMSAIEQVLFDFGNEMQQGLQAQLKKVGKHGSNQIDSGGLYQSIDFNTEIFGSIFSFKLSLADYYDRVNKGAKGWKSSNRAPNSPYRFGGNIKFAKPKDLKSWARNKGLNPFAVARSINAKGSEGSHFYDKVVTKERLKTLQRDLSKASKEDVRVLVTSTAIGVFGKTR